MYIFVLKERLREIFQEAIRLKDLGYVLGILISDSEGTETETGTGRLLLIDRVIYCLLLFFIS